MRSGILSVVFALAIISALNGCNRATQMAAPNRKLLEGLQTAVSSKNAEWLAIVSSQAAEKHEQKTMSDTEFRAIDNIIQKAKAGDWKGAQMDSFKLSDAQRPTAEDLAMLKSAAAGG